MLFSSLTLRCWSGTGFTHVRCVFRTKAGEVVASRYFVCGFVSTCKIRLRSLITSLSIQKVRSLILMFRYFIVDYKNIVLYNGIEIFCYYDFTIINYPQFRSLGT